MSPQLRFESACARSERYRASLGLQSSASINAVLYNIHVQQLEYASCLRRSRTRGASNWLWGHFRQVPAQAILHQRELLHQHSGRQLYIDYYTNGRAIYPRRLPRKDELEGFGATAGGGHVELDNSSAAPNDNSSAVVAREDAPHSTSGLSQTDFFVFVLK